MFAAPSQVCRFLVGFLLVLGTGCDPFPKSTSEEDHPLIKQAIARKQASPRESARLFAKALESNPRLALAHWELALLCLNYTSNYAASIYHFQQVLALRPDWPHANTARQLINNAKLELVREGVEAPTLPSVQRQMDRLVADLHALTAERTNLLAQIRYLTGVTQQLAAENLQWRQAWPTAAQPGSPNGGPTLAPADPSGNRLRDTPATAPQLGAASSPNRSRPPASGIGNRPTPTRPEAAPSTERRATYRVQRGDTAFAISRRFGITVRDLVAANPNLNPAALKAGQILKLPQR
jgi:LysM repeat protein